MVLTLPRKIAAGLMLLTLPLGGGLAYTLLNVSTTLNQKTERAMASLEQAAGPAPGLADGGAGGEATDEAAVDSGAVVDFDEMIFSLEVKKGVPRSLVLKIDLELFQSGDKEVIQKQRSGIKNCVIELMADQSFEHLKTLSGKLLFKERLVGSINTFLNHAIVRDIQLSSFVLR